MPITIPIVGAGAPGTVTTIYPVYAGLSISGATALLSAQQAVSIEGNSSASVQGGVSVGAMRSRSVPQAMTLGNISIDTTPVAMQVSSGEGFAILVDVISTVLSGPNMGSYGSYYLNARLTVDGDEVPIKAFSYQVPTGRLGSILNVTLRSPDVTVIPAGASVTFDLIVSVGPDTNKVFNLMTGGKLQERSNQIAYIGGPNAKPNDQVTFSALDVVADMFSLAPRRPVVMYDPERVKYDEVRTDSRSAMREENGTIIQPVIEPVNGLTMKQSLQRAYTAGGGVRFVTTQTSRFADFNSRWASLLAGTGTNPDQEGLQFSAVVTNISNYRIRRADFTIEGGWHSGASPSVAMYSPLYFTHEDILFIYDMDKPLPAGIVGHNLSLGQHKSLTERLNYRPDSNAVALTYQYQANDPSEDAQRQYRDVFTSSIDFDSTDEREYDEETTDEGPTVIYGSSPTDEGYCRIETRRWDREFYFADTPDDILDTLPLRVETTTISAYTLEETGGPVTHAPRISHRETTRYRYAGDLKVGWTKDIEAGIKNFILTSFETSLMVIERETGRQSWVDDPENQGNKILDQVVITVESRAFIDPEEQTIEDAGIEYTYHKRYPVLAIEESAINLTEEWELTDLIPYKTIRKALRRLVGEQLEMEVIEYNHLTNTVHKTSTEPTSGQVYNDAYGTKSRTILLRDLVSEAEIGPRIPIAVNALELPRTRALELGRRALRRLNDPLQSLPVSLAGVDFVIARGTVLAGEKRIGYTTQHIVTGYSIDGSNLGTENHRISQTIEASELLSV